MVHLRPHSITSTLHSHTNKDLVVSMVSMDMVEDISYHILLA